MSLDYDFAVARYTAAGVLDTTFNSTGKRTVSLGTSNDYAYAEAIQSGGKIVVAGSSGSSLDDTAFAMAIEDDGTIVVGGQENNDLALGFFNSDGSVDTAHDADGIVTQDLGGTEKINALIAQSDGTIVVGGVKGNDFVIAKFTSSWILDSTFGASSGYTDTNMGGATGEGAYGLARQNDGKFAAAGRAGSSFGVARYTSSGILDTTFNSTGKVTTSLSTSVDYAYAVTVGPDYRITTAGVSANFGSNQNFALARYKVASGLEQRIYAQTDGNHNITSLANVFGSVLQRFVYDPNGSATVLNASFGVTSDAYSWVTLFQGKRFDATTGLYNYDFREYSPTLGTFMSVDPTGYPDGADRYRVSRKRFSRKPEWYSNHKAGSSKYLQILNEATNSSARRRRPRRSGCGNEGVTALSRSGSIAFPGNNGCT